MVDQDLSRLYPEHGSYFQTPGCQGMLRRVLLLWCLRHPECGYRQGILHYISLCVFNLSKWLIVMSLAFRLLYRVCWEWEGILDQSCRFAASHFIFPVSHTQHMTQDRVKHALLEEFNGTDPVILQSCSSVIHDKP